MKVFRLIPLLCMFLSSCSYSFLFAPTPSNPPLAASATPTDILSPTTTNTITPIPPTATFTETPTLIYLGPSPTMAGTDNPTGTPGSIFSATPSSTETPPLSTIPQNSFFKTITLSGDHILWGACEPTTVKITAHIDDVSKIHTVTLWLRLENKKTGDATEWGGGAIMNDEGNGDFTYNVTAKSFNHYREFTDAWGQYQLVASDRSLNRIAGSSQYMNNLTVSACP